MLGLLQEHQPRAPGEVIRVERRMVVMGTELYAAVETPDRARGIAALEGAFAAVQQVDDVLSTWRPDAEMARLNAAPPGVPYRLSPELAAWLVEAAWWRTATGGAFEPAIGALIDAWDLRGSGRQPDGPQLDRARAAARLERFQFVPGDTSATRLDARSWIDTGGFGKGAGLRAAQASLRRAGVTAALLNFGGQVMALGVPVGGQAWIVPVAHPERRGDAVATLALADRAASTTSQSERFVIADGERLGHVLDPATGRPAPAWGSATVVHADPFVADVLSTALFVMGPDVGLQWAAAHDVAALMVVLTPSGVTPRCSAAMRRFLDEECFEGRASVSPRNSNQ